MSTPASPTASARTPVTLFYSYAHEDETLRDELQDHLMILERRGVVRSWHDRAIVAGHDWSREIDNRLHAADLVLLLISKDFIASDYIIGAEMTVAMERHRRGDVVVVPILLRQVDLQPEDAEDLPFVDLLAVQGLPRDLKPVTSWTNRDEAWTSVASGLRVTINEIRARRPVAAAVARESAESLEAIVDNPRLDAVVGDFAQRISAANVAKGGDALEIDRVQRQARRLIDVPDAKRVLWVDDHPDDNLYEQAALARLQIEVVPVRTTEEGLQQLEHGTGEAVDLVISDWYRDEDVPLAGLRLLTTMRGRGFRQPVIFYHGTFGAMPRATLAATGRVAGAFGEAVLPGELIELMLAALGA